MNADRWQRIHTVGIYLVWFISLACLIDRSGRKPHPAFHYLPFIAVLVGAMAIRLGAAFKN